MENEQAEWMWTIPEYLDRIRFCFCFSIYVFLFSVDDNVET